LMKAAITPRRMLFHTPPPIPIFFSIPSCPLAMLKSLIWGIYYSLFNYTLFDFNFWGLRGYLRLLKDKYFWIALRNTAYYTVSIVPLWLFKALIISVILFPFSTKIQTLYKAMFYLPQVSSVVILSMIWLWIYEPQFGLLNSLMKMVGLPQQIWLGNKHLAMPSIIFMQLLMRGGSTIVLISAALAGIPPSFIEVARIEGANPVQVFTQIYVLTRGGPEFSTVTMVYQIYNRTFIEFDLGSALAQAVLMMVVLVILAIVQFKWLGGEVEY